MVCGLISKARLGRFSAYLPLFSPVVNTEYLSVLRPETGSPTKSTWLPKATLSVDEPVRRPRLPMPLGRLDGADGRAGAQEGVAVALDVAVDDAPVRTDVLGGAGRAGRAGLALRAARAARALILSCTPSLKSHMRSVWFVTRLELTDWGARSTVSTVPFLIWAPVIMVPATAPPPVATAMMAAAPRTAPVRRLGRRSFIEVPSRAVKWLSAPTSGEGLPGPPSPTCHAGATVCSRPGFAYSN